MLCEVLVGIADQKKNPKSAFEHRPRRVAHDGEEGVRIEDCQRCVGRARRHAGRGRHKSRTGSGKRKSDAEPASDRRTTRHAGMRYCGPAPDTPSWDK